MRGGKSNPILIVVEAGREMLQVGSPETATPLQFTNFESGVYFIHRYREVPLKVHHQLWQAF